MNMIQRHKWNIVRYFGCALPVLTTFQKEIVRKQLEERYCPKCGEYIYNPFRQRKIRHYHHALPRYRFNTLPQKRLLIHARHQLVEWTRHFPRVMRLIISEDDLFFYRGIKPHFVHRIPSLRMWTIDEWNTLHPDIPIFKYDCLRRIQHPINLDVLWSPDLVL